MVFNGSMLRLGRWGVGSSPTIRTILDGVSPSWPKARGFDPCIAGSNPATLAIFIEKKGNEMQKITRTQFENAYQSVFGAAAEANSKYGDKVTHPVTGEKCYEQQIRYGKTNKNR